MRAPPGGRDVRVSERVAEGLLRAIDRVAGRREACARDPARDFVRERKLGLRRLLTLLVTWGQDTMSAELARLAGWDGEAPSPSALTQQWGKLSDRAMPLLLETFLSMFGQRPFLGRYRLLAVDGTEVRLLPGTGGDRCRVRNGRGGRSHWELHATCLLDLARRTFEGAVFQGGAEEDEPRALCELADGLARGGGGGPRPLVLADRGFCTWNAVCHLLDAGASFCLRAKDSWAGALLRGSMPDGEFDLTVVRCLTRSTSRAGRARPGDPWLYRELLGQSRLDALPAGSRGGLWVALRVVRRRLPGGKWLNLVTDLPRCEFGAADLAELYAMRWAEETAFLHLKHAVGAGEAPRTRDYGRAVQEVLGRLVLYDACSLGTSSVPGPAPGPRHARATDRTDAFKAFADMLRSMVRRDAHDVEAFASRRSHSVRPGRGHPRRRRLRSPPRSCCRH